jgi:hypothetical protein
MRFRARLSWVLGGCGDRPDVSRCRGQHAGMSSDEVQIPAFPDTGRCPPAICFHRGGAGLGCLTGRLEARYVNPRATGPIARRYVPSNQPSERRNDAMIAPSMTTAAIGRQRATTHGIKNSRDGDHHASAPQPDRVVAHVMVDQPPASRCPQPERAEHAGCKQKGACIEERRGTSVGGIGSL